MNVFSNKKGLELPITAIVVLIIAILFLSLAGMFIKTLFTGGTELLTSELAKMKEQLRKNIEESGELFVMSEGAEMEIKKGAPKKFYFGVRNTASSQVCYRVAVRCLKPFTSGTQCSAASGAENVLVGGKDNSGTVPATGDQWFKLLDEFSVPANEVYVSPVTLQVSGNVKPDTYLMEVSVYKSNEEGKSCAETSNWPSEAGETYQNKRFHIIVG
ncbi:MAG: hypothetical protein HY363_02875 [Candidatus Aenigmarchaeota archaeon]|nr:hypothetical protein [Candidatus Aenigmarchaeota archaeon]